MTKESKGDELIEKFYKPAYHDNRARYRATQCAIIAVEEIMSSHKSFWEDKITGTGIPEQWIKYTDFHKYWTEVLNYLKSKL